MSRQITITRTELGLADLNLNDPAAGYWVSDDWKQGGVVWQRYLASSTAWVNGERTVGQRMAEVNETFTVYVNASTPSAIGNKIQTIATALSQYRYTVTINWDGDIYVYEANGAGEVQRAGGSVDPALHAAGWIALELTIPRQPGV